MKETHTRQLATIQRPPFASLRSGLLRRKCPCGATRSDNRSCEEWRQTKLKRENDNAGEMQKDLAVPPIVHEVLRSSGQPLDLHTRHFMESRFNHDFSQVRVHADEHSAESASSVGALAYTVGRHVVFGAGQYSPATTDGRRLLAHELTHVVQQQHAAPGNFYVAPAHDAFEAEANSIADGVVSTAADVQGALNSSVLQRQAAPPTTEEKKKPAEKTVTSHPAPQKVPALEVRKEVTVAPAEEKKGLEATATLATETEIKKGEHGITAEAEDKFELELAIPITDKLQVGPISILKEGSVSLTPGFPAARPYPKPLSSLEAEAAVKMLSLEFEKVKVPLGVADFEISGSALASAGYSVAEGKSELKAGFAGEAEAKFKPGAKSPFFITAKVGVEKTYDKEGNADLKWSETTYKASAGVGFEF
jgi:hypothetical protein